MRKGEKKITQRHTPFDTYRTQPLHLDDLIVYFVKTNFREVRNEETQTLASSLAVPVYSVFNDAELLGISIKFSSPDKILVKIIKEVLCVTIQEYLLTNHWP